MGWTVLYIAFGCVALWLLGEVLLQYKARLRWRLLAFTGFLGVVLGVFMSSIPVIFVGTAAFATGQLFVTLSFRRGFSTGWALGGNPGSSRRRRSEEEPPPVRDSEPALEVSQLEETETATYQPLPMPDDTGQYGVYERGDINTGATADAYAASASASGQYGQPGQYAPAPDQFEPYGQAAPASQDAYASAGYDTAAFDTSSYDTGSYGTGSYNASSYGTGSYDTGSYGTGSYDTGSYGTSSYDTGYGFGDTGDIGDTGSYDTAAYSASPYGINSYDTYGGGIGTTGASGTTGYYSSGAGNYQDTYSSPLYSTANDQPYQDTYGYGGGYGAYPDPYASGGAAPQPSFTGPNDLYDPLSGDYHGGFYPAPSGSTGYGGYDAEQYPTGGYPPETPPGGVWVPPQREPDPLQQPPPPYPQQSSGDYGYYDPQQRY